MEGNIHADNDQFHTVCSAQDCCAYILYVFCVKGKWMEYADIVVAPLRRRQSQVSETESMFVWKGDPVLWSTLH